MDNLLLNREDKSRMTPVSILGFILVGSGGYLIYSVASELWKYIQDGQHHFISITISKLDSDDFLFVGDTPITLGSSAKFIVGSIIFLILASVLASIATTLISTGANLLSPQIADFKQKMHTLGTRIQVLEKNGK